MNLPNPPIGAGTLTTIAAILGAIGVFVTDWAQSGDINTGLAGLVAALVAIFFGGRSYQAGKLYEPVSVKVDGVPTNVEIDAIPVDAHEGAMI